MKKALLLIYAVAAFVFMGNPAVFKTETYHETFVGQGAEWKGEMQKTGSLVFYRYQGVLSCDNKVNCEVTLTYTGNQKELIAQKYYSFTYGSAQLTCETEGPMTMDKVYREKDEGISAYADSAYPISVDIDGKKDSFTLQKIK